MRSALLLVVIALAIGLAAPAAAQPGAGVRPERPFRGLFGSGVGDASQSLVASLTLSGGYDEDLLAVAEGRGRSSSDQRAGGFGGGQAGLGYSLTTQRLTFGASYGASARYFPAFEQPSVIVQPGYAWTPAQNPFEEPEVPGAPDLDFVVSHQTYLRHMTTGSLRYGHGFTRRLSFSSSYSVRRSYFEVSGDRIRHSAGAGLRYAISRGIGASVGYSYRIAQYGGGRSFDDHVIDAGIDFSRALSFSNRTTLSFHTGSGITTHEGDRARVGFSGGASLNHEIGRTWGAAITYGRGWRYADIFEAPVFSDSVSIGIGGLISRRLQFAAGAAATSGGVGFTERNGLIRMSGSAALTMGLTQFVGLSLAYVYYRHDFEADVVLAPGVLRTSERHGVRAAVSVMAPIFQRSRRPNAAR
jgi:hypothetical protein